MINIVLCPSVTVLCFHLLICEDFTNLWMTQRENGETDATDLRMLNNQGA